MINKYKKFVLGFVVLLLLTIGFHYFAWIKYTSHVLLVHDDIYTGDLGRMSLYANSSFPRQAYPSAKSVNLPREHINFVTWYKTKQNVDMITIGDSFSNAATQGTNPFYQDYIATYNNFSVLNLNQLSGLNYIETITALTNNGLIEQINPKYILIESVERFSIGRFANNIDFNITRPLDLTINEFNRLSNPYLGKDENIKFINNQNFKAVKNNILYNFDDRAFNTKCYKKELKKDFFTSKDKNSLLFFKEDIDVLYKATMKNIEKLNDNFNKLAEILEKKGITLIFMPAADKYNLYSKYIKDNNLPNSVFFENLRKLPKKYIFIDTKNILSKALEDGVKDLYYPDDTHWSYKASDIIFRDFNFKKEIRVDDEKNK
ncbi:alginate O-acetyltransferase AlgX-related protein [Campylobacterota bacterium DY0563]